MRWPCALLLAVLWLTVINSKMFAAAGGGTVTNSVSTGGLVSPTASADPQAHLAYPPGQAPEFWSVAAADTIMARWPDFTKAISMPGLM